MNNHPLTDEICKTIYCTWPEEHETSLVCDNMRAATDWQLRQVIEWLKATKSTVKLCPSVLAVQLEQAMRPQQQEDQ